MVITIRRGLTKNWRNLNFFEELTKPQLCSLRYVGGGNPAPRESEKAERRVLRRDPQE